jgi:hypothetical protein
MEVTSVFMKKIVIPLGAVALACDPATLEEIRRMAV